jgi:very-short-patch-repair endonuclease
MQVVDAEILRWAGRRFGLVTRSELYGFGLSPDQIDWRLRSGFLERVHRGVYRVAGTRRSFEGDVHAACLATGGYASSRCAGALFNLRRVTASTPEVSVPRRDAPHLVGVRVRAVPRLAPSDLTRIGLIPVTHPARILLDLARDAPELTEGALNDALLRGVVSIARLEELVARAGGRGQGGTPHLRALVSLFRDGRRPTESPLEDDLLAVLRRYGLPEPVPQYEIRLPGDRVRLDFAYPEEQVGIEADGDRYHSSPRDRARGRRRDARLAVIGWEVLHFGAEEIDNSPAEVAGQVDEVLGARGRRLSA